MEGEGKRSVENRVIGEYGVMDMIGAGTHGTVYKVFHLFSHHIFALKEYELQNMEEREGALSESRRFCAMTHPHVLPYQSSFLLGSCLYLVAEFAIGGTLRESLSTSPGGIPTAIIWKYFLEIISALKYLHTHHILHRDVKSTNVFICDGGRAKLGDFGFSFNSDRVVCVPPELLQGKSYGAKSDMWALGSLLHELLMANRHTLDSCDPELMSMCKSCLMIDAGERPSAAEILHHPCSKPHLSVFGLNRIDDEDEIMGVLPRCPTTRIRSSRNRKGVGRSQWDLNHAKNKITFGGFEHVPSHKATRQQGVPAGETTHRKTAANGFVKTNPLYPPCDSKGVRSSLDSSEVSRLTKKNIDRTQNANPCEVQSVRELPNTGYSTSSSSSRGNVESHLPEICNERTTIITWRVDGHSGTSRRDFPSIGSWEEVTHACSSSQEDEDDDSTRRFDPSLFLAKIRNEGETLVGSKIFKQICDALRCREQRGHGRPVRTREDLHEFAFARVRDENTAAMVIKLAYRVVFAEVSGQTNS